MTRPVLVVLGRSRPHEFLFLVFSLIWGVAYLIGAPAPTSMASVMPLWVVKTWAAGMLLSGVVGLVGVLFVRRSIERALLLEQSAMLFGAAALIMWTVTAFSFAGMRAGFAGGFAAAIAAAHLWRAWQIRNDLDELAAGAAEVAGGRR